MHQHRTCTEAWGEGGGAAMVTGPAELSKAGLRRTRLEREPRKPAGHSEACTTTSLLMFCGMDIGQLALTHL